MLASSSTLAATTSAPSRASCRAFGELTSRVSARTANPPFGSARMARTRPPPWAPVAPTTAMTFLSMSVSFRPLAVRAWLLNRSGAHCIEMDQRNKPVCREWIVAGKLTIVDQLFCMKVFSRVVELGSFARASEDLAVARPTVTTAVAAARKAARRAPPPAHDASPEPDRGRAHVLRGVRAHPRRPRRDRGLTFELAHLAARPAARGDPALVRAPGLRARAAALPCALSAARGRDLHERPRGRPRRRRPRLCAARRGPAARFGARRTRAGEDELAHVRRARLPGRARHAAQHRRSRAPQLRALRLPVHQPHRRLALPEAGRTRELHAARQPRPDLARRRRDRRGRRRRRRAGARRARHADAALGRPQAAARRMGGTRAPAATRLSEQPLPLGQVRALGEFAAETFRREGSWDEIVALAAQR